MRRAAQMIEDKIRELRGKTGVADDERAALMAALQIAFESQLAPAAKTESAKAAKKADSHPAAKNDSAAPDFTDILRRIDGALARTESSLQGRAPMA